MLKISSGLEDTEDKKEYKIFKLQQKIASQVNSMCLKWKTDLENYFTKLKLLIVSYNMKESTIFNTWRYFSLHL